MTLKLQEQPSTALSSPQRRIEIPNVVPEFESLTPREYEIARQVAMGYSNKEVARALEISHWTVAAHLKATFLKLGIGRRTELAYLLRKLI